MTDTVEPDVHVLDTTPTAATSQAVQESTLGSERHFRTCLGAAAVIGLVLRATWVLATRHLYLWGDAYYYHYQANLLAEGHGFIEPFIYLHGGGAHPSAYHPPLWVLYLAAFSVVGLKSWLTHRLAGCLLGAATVVLIGLVARRVAGARVGVLAAALAAVYPYLWINDGVGMSESMVLVACAGAVLAAYRLIDRPTLWRAAALGALCALAALARAEQVLLIGVLALPVILMLRQRTLRQRAVLLAVCAVAATVTVAPWVVRNLVTFDHPVTLSTNLEPTLVVSNCASTFDRHSALYAFWDVGCIASAHPPGDESDQNVYFRRQATNFLSHHKRQAVVVFAARVGRLWNIYRPLEGTRLDLIEGHPLWASRLGLAMFAALAPLAGAGAVALHRRRVPLAALLSLPIVVTATAALIYGTTRFRAPAEITLVVLASVAIEALATRTWPHRNHGRRFDPDHEIARVAPSGALPADQALRPAAGRFPCFDGYRALAALSVLLVHVAFLSGFSLRHRTLGQFTARLDIGVSVFFVISGFLLYRPFAVAHLTGTPMPRLGPYLRRRALRIIPAYWLALTVIAFVLHDTAVHGLEQIVVYYGFLQIYWGRYLNGGITQAWSLCTELSFYLFLPLWALVVGRIARRQGASQTRVLSVELTGTAALYLASLACRALLLEALFNHRVGIVGALYWLPTTLDQFALGMALAVVSAWAAQQSVTPTLIEAAGRRPWLWWGGAAATFWAVSTQLGLPRDLGAISTAQWMGREVLYGLCALALLVPGVLGAQDRGLIRRLLRNRAVQAAGLVSYAIYLWHTAAIDEFHKRTHTAPFSGHFPAMLGFVLATTLAVAAGSYILVEKPALRLKGQP